MSSKAIFEGCSVLALAKTKEPLKAMGFKEDEIKEVYPIGAFGDALKFKALFENWKYRWFIEDAHKEELKKMTIKHAHKAKDKLLKYPGVEGRVLNHHTLKL